MQATQPVPLRTVDLRKLGLAAIPLAAAMLGAFLATQIPWAGPATQQGAVSAQEVEAALIQVRAGERESLGLTVPGAFDSSTDDYYKGFGSGEGVAPKHGNRGQIPN